MKLMKGYQSIDWIIDQILRTWVFKRSSQSFWSVALQLSLPHTTHLPQCRWSLMGRLQLCILLLGRGLLCFVIFELIAFPCWYRWRHPTACIVAATALTQQTSTTIPPTTSVLPTTTVPPTTTPLTTTIPPWIVHPTTTTTTAWVEPSPQQGHNRQSPSRFPTTQVLVSFNFFGFLLDFLR